MTTAILPEDRPGAHVQYAQISSKEEQPVSQVEMSQKAVMGRPRRTGDHIHIIPLLRQMCA